MRDDYESPPVDKVDPGCGTLTFRALVVVDLSALTLGFIIMQQPAPYGMDVGPGPGFFGILLLAPAALLGVVLLTTWLSVAHAWLSVALAWKEIVRSLLGISLAAFVIAVVANSGVWPPKTYYLPDTVGPITEIQEQRDTSYVLVLASGEWADVSHGGSFQGGPTPGPSAFVPLGDIPELRIDDLLVAGKRPAYWYLIAEANPGATYPEGCHALSLDAVEKGDHFELPSGVRLDKAADYRGRAGVGTDVRRRALCLDGQADVTLGD